jgi:hypothetical protein
LDRRREEDREKLLELKVLLGIDQPKLTREQKEALHRQGTAGISSTTGEEPQPPLTREEGRLIVEANARSLPFS